MRVDRLFRDANLVTLTQDRPGLGVIEDGVLATHHGRIVYCGSRYDAPRFDAVELWKCEGRWITPGLIDCHTHLVYAGDRAGEFAMRAAGKSYEQIAKAGGGIVSTVKATRLASKSDLVEESLPRLDALIAEGVTTVEIKSGYGLDHEHESRQLRAAAMLGQHRKVTVVPTYLGAHAVPPEAKGAKGRERYLSLVIDEMIPFVAKERLATAVDAFCEGIAFTPEETERVFKAAKAAGLAVKLHADQLSDTGGAKLAARYAALSADHLEYANDEGIAAMAQVGTVAVLLPGAFYTLRETKVPPIAAFRKAGLKMAIATDCNPGSSPLTSPLLAMNMAATLFKMTVEECIAGFTREAAHALGRSDIGTLEVGKRSDLAIWSITNPAELVYRMGYNPLHARYWRG
jgi:imidazolonepropionase